MRLIKETSPYIHRKSSVKRMMLDVLIALLPVVIFAIVINGWNALYVILLSLVTMISSELVFVYLTKQTPYDGYKKTFKEKIKNAYQGATINNIITPAISAVIYSMIMPAGANWYVVIIGALFGIVVGKLLFGGLGSNIFNPAALGRVSVMVCFGSDITYLDAVAGGTPLQQLSENLANINNYSLSDLFLGNVPGSMGEVSALLILIGGIYLLIRKSCDWRPMVGMLASFIVLMLVAGFVVEDVNCFKFMLYQTLAGGLVFGAIFMITDPVTSPTTGPGRFTYGIIVGLLAVLIRLLGAYPEGVAFAILLGNMLVPVIDYYKWQSNKVTYKHIILWASFIVSCSLIIVFAI